MKAFLHLFLFTSLLTTISLTSMMAQGEPSNANPEYVKVVLHDGTSRVGMMLGSDEEVIRIETQHLGVVAVPKHLVKGITTLDVDTYSRFAQNSMGRALSINPQSSRYFFAPSGIQLKKGEGYFQTNIAMNSVSLGVNDHITIGGLISFVGTGATAKIGTSINEHLHVSFGGIGFSDYFGELGRPVGLVFANATIGSEDKNLTFNLGTGSKFDNGIVSLESWVMDPDDYYSYIITSYYEGSVRPLLFSVSGMNQIAENRWFITENYFIRNFSTTTLVTGASMNWYGDPAYYLERSLNSSAGILSMGVRNLSMRNGWLWDYGMVGVIGKDDDGDRWGFAAPWVSATLAF